MLVVTEVYLVDSVVGWRQTSFLKKWDLPRHFGFGACHIVPGGIVIEDSN